MSSLARLWVALVSIGCARPAAPVAAPPKAVVLVSANAEWKVVKQVYPDARYEPTPWGESFELDIPRKDGGADRVVFLHGGWGKVAAAGSAQYAIDRWRPRYVINLGTCGGFAGAIAKHAIVLVDRTLIYDIVEAMGDSAEAIRDYAVDLDLSWLTGAAPSEVTRTTLVSGDRDLVPAELAALASSYGAVAGDWESGAIAYTCARNRQRVLILRGVSDLVGAAGSETYGDMAAFADGASLIMRRLLGELPGWLARCP
jgi:adenosylhomocysteine nucleosidase